DKLRDKLSDDLIDIWKSSKRKLILFGMSDINSETDALLQQLTRNDQLVLLTETCSNRQVDLAIKTIDRVITTFEDENEIIQPDLVVSLGGSVISKKIKKLLQDFKPSHHWWVGEADAQNTFGALSADIKSDANSFLKQVSMIESINKQEFQNTWRERNEKLKLKHNEFLGKAPYSDLLVFDTVLKNLPSSSVLHMANSTPVRYVQLFDQRNDIKYLANRGVSGIDGSTSTALGYSLKSGELNVLITGDLSFFYDSNAFLHDYRDANLRIIIINNSGGSIFRIIPGPSGTSQLEKFFEARHDFSAEHLAKFYGLDYQRAEDTEKLKEVLSTFFDSSKSGISILEIFTDNELNPKVLESYFEYIKE
ncbi:MAG: 2-succinyl-5-enolpyruvyl-6-hydroxy-3-cyclohexene-1-carboxylate synthase, partial [Saprospiraceae bacterium]|nr:2-succinyl-5-enolpyruvyl-6-hydroxy-3-cyclohexene-1-carboxylate synthase [Saprospiraceae bacterium]